MSTIGPIHANDAADISQMMHEIRKVGWQEQADIAFFTLKLN